MELAVLTVVISLPGCTSLKEKRQRIGGLHERLGRNPNIAVCESGQRNVLGSSEWSFVVTGISKAQVQALLSEIEEKLKRAVDGRLLEITRQFL